MDILKSITYLTEDEEWLTKIGLGGLLAMVPVLNLAMYGYQKETLRRLQQGERRPLPAWNDLSGYWSTGWPVGLAMLIYALPALVIVMVMFGAWFGAIIGLSSTEGRDLPPSVLVFAAVALGALGLNIVFSLVLGLIHPAVILTYAQRGTFGACFDFGSIFGLIRQNLRSYIILCLVQWVVNVGLSLGMMFIVTLVSIIPCLGQLLYIVVLGAYSFSLLLIQAHLLAQFQQTAISDSANPVISHP